MWYSTFTADDFDILWYVTYLTEVGTLGRSNGYNIIAIGPATQCLRVQHITATYLCTLPCMHVFACT